MRSKVALLALALYSAGAWAVDDWWTKSSLTMGQIVAQGHQIVGFSTLAERSPIMDVKVNRFILQKESSVFMCVEKLSTATSDVLVKGCYSLRGTN